MDIHFLRLSKNWALAYDKHQWIIQRRHGADKRTGQYQWEAVSFIASTRDHLLKCGLPVREPA